MDKQKQEEKQELVDAVIEEMKRDISNNDWMAIDELLYHHVDTERLEAFLPEKQDQEEQDEPMSINKWRGILQELAQRCPPDRWADDAQEGPSPDTFECGYCCALMQLHAMSMREDHCIPIDEFPIPYIVERYEEEQGTSHCKKCRAVIKNGGDWGYCTCCYEETRAEEEQDDE